MRKGLVIAVALAAVLESAAPSFAGPLEDAASASARGDYATALRLWRPLADQGNAKAQSSLGSMYALGLGVPKDNAEAVRWARKAAEQGIASAQTFLGVMYAEGRGVLQDYAEALKWYRKAADQGNAKAQNNLGAMYMNGQGVAQDYVQAHKWFNLAAASFPTSGTKKTSGTKNKSPISPKMQLFLNELRSSLPTPPPTGRDMAVMNRDRVARMMTPAQIAEAQKLAREFSRRGASWWFWSKPKK